MAVSPRSSVRIRIASSIGRMKTLPSPILPIFADDDLELHLWEKIDGVLASAVDFRVALLPSEAFDFRDGHPLHADFRQRFFNVLHLERLDDRLDFLHAAALLTGRAGAGKRQFGTS